MKDKCNRYKLQIFAIACVVVLVAAGTFAWYAFVRNTDIIHDSVTTEDGASIVCENFTVYTRTTDAEGNKQYQVYNSIPEITMNTYDSVFGKNEDTAIFIRIPVEGSTVDGTKDIKLEMSRNNPDGYDSLTDNKGLISKETNQELNLEEGKIINFLTNISKYKCMLIPELNSAANGEAQTIYETAFSSFEDNNPGLETKYYATQTKENKVYTVSKSDTNKITWTLTSGEITAAKVAGENKIYVYIEVNYDEHLVAAYLQNHEGNFVARKLGETQLLHYVGDLDQLTATSTR